MMDDVVRFLVEGDNIFLQQCREIDLMQKFLWFPCEFDTTRVCTCETGEQQVVGQAFKGTIVAFLHLFIEVFELWWFSLSCWLVLCAIVGDGGLLSYSSPGGDEELM